MGGQTPTNRVTVSIERGRWQIWLAVHGAEKRAVYLLGDIPNDWCFTVENGSGYTVESVRNASA